MRVPSWTYALLLRLCVVRLRMRTRWMNFGQSGRWPVVVTFSSSRSVLVKHSSLVYGCYDGLK